MADDVTLNSMAGGSTVATDEIGGKHHQRIKLIHGNDGVNDGDVSSENPLPTTPAGDTATLATSDDTTSNVTLLSANAARKKFIIFNDSDQDLYVKYGATASASDHTWLVPAGATLEEEHYTGQVDGLWAANSTDKARITEIDS